MGDEESNQNNSSESTETALSRDSTLAYAGMALCAAILLIALCSKNSGWEQHKHYEYGIAVASIAMIFSFLGWTMAYTNKPGTDRVLLYNNYFLFLWNFIGTSFLTFGGPFVDTGNGYFAAWGLVVFSTLALGVSATSVQQHLSITTHSSAALFACSIVVLTAISFHGINDRDPNFAELVYSLIVTIITILITGATLSGKVPTTPASELYIMALMMILWSVLAGLLTFRGPFLVTGNGYFGSWGGAFAAVYGVNRARQAQSDSS